MGWRFIGTWFGTGDFPRSTLASDRDPKATVTVLHPTIDPDTTFLIGEGEMGARIRAFDWKKTSLGPIPTLGPNPTWPQSPRTMVSMVINSRLPSYLVWGPDLIGIDNDAYKPPTGAKSEIPGGRDRVKAGREARSRKASS